ncbi:MAG: hypothetical protein JRN35_09635, partial [Nitrososphaerota archaeon]|nr:hypothetical protein [Nitrososphaerota archaeon]
VFLLPLLERGFGVLSDMALTELLDVNHPLLREFYLKAPGSYQHSMCLGAPVEVVARLEVASLKGVSRENQEGHSGWREGFSPPCKRT